MKFFTYYVPFKRETEDSILLMKKKLKKQQLITEKDLWCNAVLTKLNIRVEVTTFYQLIFPLRNILHIYEIWD